MDREKSATLPDILEALGSERVVYVGETHTAFGDHLLQLEVLRAMAGQPGRLAVGVEWFQARFQPVLDDFLAGKIGEAEMLRRTEYYERWRFDYRLYRPIVRFAKDNGIPIIALNAAREVTDEISRLGLDDLPDDVRAEIPAEYDFSDLAYRETLYEMFKMHKSDDKEFERFLQVQLTWDETMARGAADHLSADPQNRILVLAGRGHIAGRSGIPNRVTRRTGLAGKTLATFQPATRFFNDVDYMVLAIDRQLPQAGLMRVMLDERGDGVYVRGFTEGSPAEEAGMEEDDVIVAINGEPIRFYTDIKVAMLERRPGDKVNVTVLRDSLIRGEETLTLAFELVGGESPHHR